MLTIVYTHKHVKSVLRVFTLPCSTNKHVKLITHTFWEICIFCLEICKTNEQRNDRLSESFEDANCTHLYSINKVMIYKSGKNIGCLHMKFVSRGLTL